MNVWTTCLTDPFALNVCIACSIACEEVNVFFLHRLAEMENRNGSYVNENISPNESM